MSVAALFPVWADLFSIAMHDEEASHILLVPFVFAWLLWGARDRLKACLPVHREWGLALIAAAVACHELGLKYNLQILWHFSAIVALVGAIWLVSGANGIRIMLPAIVVLLFLMPIPGLFRQQVSLSIQSYSAGIAQYVLTFFGLNVQRNGCVLAVNGTVVTVAEACNGMRMLFAVLLVVYAMAFSLARTRLTQAMILTLSPVLALLLNVVRLSISAWTFSACSEEVAQTWHDINGWLIPGLLMLAIFLLTDNRGHAIGDSDSAAKVWAFGTTGTAGAIAVSTLLVCFTINCSRIPEGNQTSYHRNRVAQQLNDFPFCVDDWLGVSGEMHTDELRLLKPITAFRRDYSHVVTGDHVSVVAVFTNNARDLVGHEPGICLTGQGWTLISQAPVSWAVGNSEISGRAYEFSFGENSQIRRQVISILLMAGGESSGDIAAVANAAADFRRAPYGACSLQISSDQIRSSAGWRKLAEPFVQAIRPVVNSFIACRTQGYDSRMAAAQTPRSDTQLLPFRSAGREQQGGLQ